VISGFGGRMHTEPYQSRHYAVVRRFLERLCRGAERAYGLRLEVEEPELSGEERVARAARPVIVLCRHSGPGDSLLLVQQLLSVYGRRPRVVMKATLQFDPLVDVFGNRLPNVFIQHRDGGEGMLTEQIERLARGLDRSGALVIFPEGGHWTPGRWRRGVRRLEAAGRKDLADRARAMPNLLPPRPGGTVAAIRACPDADVIFVAHAGLDTILSIGDVWRRFPINQVIRARWWRVRFDEVPRDAAHEEQVQWLFGWWERLDRWIAENRPVGAAAPAVKPEVHSDTALHCARAGSPLRLPGLDGHRRSGARVVLITGPAVVVVLEVDVGIGLVGGAVVVTGGVVSDTVVVSAAVVLVVRAGVVVVVVVVL
jgi:1-acyl-sn-glycerol-3-phosphate acyltransferase